MKGQILLVSQIVAQGTKVKAWEIVVTKVGILSFVMQKYRTLVFGINLISILQSGHLDESVFLPALSFPDLAFITASILLGRLLITFLQTSFSILSIPPAEVSKAHAHKQGGPHMQ
jgi:hypothetical protein